MKKTGRYNDPLNYCNMEEDFGFSHEKVPSDAVYAVKEKEEIYATVLPYNGRPAEELALLFDDVDFAVIEEIGRSKYLSSLQVYQYITLRGMTVKRKGIRRRLDKLMRLRVIKEYEITLDGAARSIRFYELDFKGVRLAMQRGVEFHKGNSYMSERRKKELGVCETVENVKRILVGNMIILGLLMNNAHMERFGIMETMRPVQEAPITNGCIIRTAANVQIDEDSVLLYEVVRSTPHALRKLADKVRRYYTLINSESYVRENFYGHKTLPQLVLCGESYEHNCKIDSYLRSKGLWSVRDSILYTEDLYYVRSTLQTLYELDENGNRRWYSLPSKDNELKEKSA
ncbi:hypothetical protein [Ruminococcus sp. 5_1_39BFAA]|uniref:hypothetical protein n=1 Tax=Ruminococcus sp. 5_1_39BFAA TaxID=457412 RepID=UPI0035659543